MHAILHNCNIHCIQIALDEKAEADIRLIGGKDATQGRIEVGLDGVWGTVCHESWDIHDAEVVCRQLGYSGAMAATLRGSASFAAGTGRIWATTFGCKGEEQSILDCLHPTWGEIGSCTHSSDAGVVCQSGKCKIMLLIFALKYQANGIVYIMYIPILSTFVK